MQELMMTIQNFVKRCLVWEWKLGFIFFPRSSSGCWWEGSWSWWVSGWRWGSTALAPRSRLLCHVVHWNRLKSCSCKLVANYNHSALVSLMDSQTWPTEHNVAPPQPRCLIQGHSSAKRLSVTLSNARTLYMHDESHNMQTGLCVFWQNQIKCPNG